MTIWMPDLSAHPGPRYAAIADAIAAGIERGDLPAGERLPPQRDLAWKLGVTVGTVSRGYMLAEQRGLLSGEVGRGTFVRERRLAAGASLLDLPDGYGIDLTRNMPGGAGYGDALRQAMEDLSHRSGIERLLHYMPAAGHPLHRAAGAQWMKRVGLEVRPEQVVLTGGAQQAVAAVLGSLVEPGATVLCESLTYCGFMDAARLHRVNLEGVAMDAEGMLPEALDRAAVEKNAQVVFLVPTIQNPTTATMSAGRRADIVKVARARDLTIVEDDVYGYLPVDRPPPIATLAPERSIYLASASKCIAPGLRIGWLACPPALVERFVDAVHAMSIALPALPAEIVRTWIADGTAAKLTEGLRAETAARQKLATDIFAGFTMDRDPAALHLFLHLPQPWRREEFVDAARALGIIVVPASTFAVGRTAAPHAIRLSLSSVPERADLNDALIRLRDLAMNGPSARRTVI